MAAVAISRLLAENDRPPHVEVGPDTNVTAGLLACLVDIHAVGKSAIEWDVVDVWNTLRDEPAHFTCYYGPDARSKVNEFR